MINEPIVLDILPLKKTKNERGVNRRNQPEFEASKKACEEELKLIMEQTGILSANLTSLMKRHDLTWHTVDRIKQGLVARAKMSDLHTVAVDFQARYKKILQQQGDVLVDPSAPRKDKREASKIILDAMTEYTKFLEAYGFKDTIKQAMIEAENMTVIDNRSVNVSQEKKYEFLIVHKYEQQKEGDGGDGSD
jgi:hypothetical protein